LTGLKQEEKYIKKLWALGFEEGNLFHMYLKRAATNNLKI
jgi:hypothetical protein